MLKLTSLAAAALFCTLALCSCGGISFGSGGGGYTPYRSFDSGIDDFRYVGSPYEPLVRYPGVHAAASSPAAFLDDAVSEYQRAWDDYFDELRIEMVSGMNTVPPTAYLFGSRNLERVLTDDGPEVTLRSAFGDACFVTYGLTGRFGDEQVAAVAVNGEGENLGADSGIFLGVRQFGSARTNWYGPLDPGENVYLRLNEGLTSGYEVSAYVTVAVFNGGVLKLDGLSVDMGWSPIPAAR